MARTGRPREFDREKAVDAAMALFWEHGYEPTSLSQLKDCMGGLSPASFYAAFGSKAGLFREVVARYLETHGQATTTLKDASLPPREAIETALRRSARMQTAASHPAGCLIVLGAANCSPENRHIEALLASERDRNRRAIKAHVDRAVENGDLLRSADGPALVALINTFLLGISPAVRDGATLDELEASITRIMSVWDDAAAKPRSDAS
ncbi:TetR/AcrR family transcriptional regulator [Hansschlegelia plantiphila]|uniref:TetR family transcriptional regulator n=1 Tax=Hansschlegelia plantiphila TaxID=374655 RepID=A0A9W6J2X4_9HYPH|nr:TetR/AcrR family transcriptional regulator [Hansschlegelia plantiphila]GLK68404.1 TetR family transcriptional regulator [Hansschlegelia plantiphila]